MFVFVILLSSMLSPTSASVVQEVVRCRKIVRNSCPTDVGISCQGVEKGDYSSPKYIPNFMFSPVHFVWYEFGENLRGFESQRDQDILFIFWFFLYVFFGSLSDGEGNGKLYRFSIARFHSQGYYSGRRRTSHAIRLESIESMRSNTQLNTRGARGTFSKTHPVVYAHIAPWTTVHPLEPGGGVLPMPPAFHGRFEPKDILQQC